MVMPRCGAGTRECQNQAKTDRSSLLVSVLVIGNRCTSGAFHLILRVLMRIASPSREAMVPMNTTDSPGEPEQWTVVGIALGGGGRGGRSPPPRTSRTRGTMHQSRGSPTHHIGAVFMGNFR